MRTYRNVPRACSVNLVRATVHVFRELFRVGLASMVATTFLLRADAISALVQRGFRSPSRRHIDPVERRRASGFREVVAILGSGRVILAPPSTPSTETRRRSNVNLRKLAAASILAARHKTKWGLVATLVSKAAPIGESYRLARDRQAIMSQRRSSALTSVESMHELAAVPFWAQGDAAMYTPEAIAARIQLRTHPDVITKLQLWWDTAIRSCGAGPNALLLHKEAYMEVSRLLVKVLLPTFSPAEAEAAAEADWEADCRGKAALSRARFMDSVFELADLWTHGISVREYVDFLDTLFLRVAEPVSQEDAAYLTEAREWVWKQERKIHFAPMPEAPPPSPPRAAHVRSPPRKSPPRQMRSPPSPPSPLPNYGEVKPGRVIDMVRHCDQTRAATWIRDPRPELILRPRPSSAPTHTRPRARPHPKVDWGTPTPCAANSAKVEAATTQTEAVQALRDPARSVEPGDFPAGPRTMRPRVDASPVRSSLLSLCVRLHSARGRFQRWRPSRARCPS